MEFFLVSGILECSIFGGRGRSIGNGETKKGDSVCWNKRSDQVVAVLEKYEVVVTALQKTK